MKKFLFFLTFCLITGCSTQYVYKIDGTHGIKVQVYEKPSSLSVGSNYKVDLPFSRDVSRYEGEYFRINVKKMTEEGRLELKITKYNAIAIFFESKKDLIKCETIEAYGECQFEGFLR